MYTHIHASLLSERNSGEKGKRVGERGEGANDCGMESGGKGEEVWSESRGTPDCCYPTCSASTGAGRLAAAAAVEETQEPEDREGVAQTHTQMLNIHVQLHSPNTHCRGRVTIVTY